MNPSGVSFPDAFAVTVSSPSGAAGFDAGGGVPPAGASGLRTETQIVSRSSGRRLGQVDDPGSGMCDVSSSAAWTDLWNAASHVERSVG